LIKSKSRAMGSNSVRDNSDTWQTRDLPSLPKTVRERFEQVAANHATSKREAWAQPPAAETWLLDAPDERSLPFAQLLSITDQLWLARGWVQLNTATGLPDLRQLAIEPWNHSSELTVTVMRAVPAGRIRDAVVARAKAEAQLVEIGMGWAAPANPTASAVLAAHDRPRRGRPPLPDSHYAAVAEAYLEICDEGLQSTVLVELARRFNRPRETMRDHVGRARELGYLSRGRQGRPGASPGPRLVELRNAHSAG